MSTSSETRGGREDRLARLLALGAVAVVLGGLLTGSARIAGLPVADVGPHVVSDLASPPTYDGRPLPPYVEGPLPAHVVAPRITVGARPGPHPAKGEPLWLRVPSLGLSAAVVGVSAVDGALVPPSDPGRLGWWTGGAEPGAVRGAVVITGHTVSTGGGAMDHLGRIHQGDRVVVLTGSGRIVYVVDEVARYSKATLSEVAERVFGRQGPGRLVLVTCTDFDGREYLGNTLVFAEPPP